VASYLLDTHVWAWSLLRVFLPPKIAGILTSADTISISAISFYEIRQKVRIGKWPEMAPHAEQLTNILSSQGANAVAITPEISDLAGALDWEHRDPFDRLIAATAIDRKLALISADEIFDQLSGRADWPGRIW
jgi:PIN domain nuclease of toxin-antitoxin system